MDGLAGRKRPATTGGAGADVAWHYLRADPEQASVRAKELLDDQTGFTRNIDLLVFEGNKVIEVRNARVNV